MSHTRKDKNRSSRPVQPQAGLRSKDERMPTPRRDRAPLAVRKRIPQISGRDDATRQSRTGWGEWFRSLVRSSPALVFSVLFHVVVILGLGILTIASVQPQLELVLTATRVDADTPPTKMDSIELDQSEELELTEADLEAPAPDMSLITISDLELPTVSEASAVAAASAAGESAAGKVSAKPKELTEHSTKDAVQFAGTAAAGNRFAFVVDNSSSMVGGKMLATIDQLLRAVKPMKSSQEFFVVLYSDTAYPMFYPDSATGFVQATKENKFRLREWAKTIEINRGGDLAAAMKIVFTLQPDAVFLLGDGAGYGKDERQMMTGFNPQRKCVINTIALNAKKAGIDNLMGIARANNGQFQFLEIHPAFIEMSQSVKFPKNPEGHSWSDRLGR